MTAISGLEFRPLHIPAHIDDDDAADFIAMVDVRNAIYRDLDGDGDDVRTAAELLPYFRSSEHETRHFWLVLRDGSPVGRMGVDIPHEGETHVAFVLIELLREHWGQGIGSAAMEIAARCAADDERTVLQTWATHQSAPGERLVAPTGFGSVPDDHIARFLNRHGFTLEQVERRSAFDLPGDVGALRARHAEAEAQATGYRVLQWTLPTPEEHRAGYAWMKSRMSTDAPSADMESYEEAWDAARLEESEQRYLDGGRTMLVTAAQHIASGELCAFNELVIGPDPEAASSQEDTLVLKEHRGHRLGMLVKTAGLLRWPEIAPRSPRLVTYNAEENRPMLDINEAIGFVPVAYNGAWQRTR